MIHLASWRILSPVLLLVAATPVLGQEPEKAYLRVHVPTPDTKLEIQGKVTSKVGTTRLFESPLLPQGKSFIYDLKATWVEDGKPMVRQKTARVMAGQTTEIDLAIEDRSTSTPPPIVQPDPKPMVPVKPSDPKPMTPTTPTDPKPMGPVKPADPKPMTPTTPTDPKPMVPVKPADPKPMVPTTPTDPKPMVPVKPADPKPMTPTKPPIDTPAVVTPRPPIKLDAPFIKTPQKIVEDMLKLAKVKEGDVVYDLGCGDGRIVITAVKSFGATKGVGLDIDPARILDSITNAQRENVANKTEFREADVMKLTERDLADATVVTLYLSPKCHNQLGPILKKLKPGTRIVAKDYKIDNWLPTDSIDYPEVEGLDHSIYLWIVK